MPQIEKEALFNDLVGAVRAVLSGHWKEVRPFAEAEMRKLAITAVQIETGRLNGTLSDAQAKILLRMQENASLSALTAVETIGMIAAQDAINAALGVLKAAVNTSLGVPLL